MILFWVEGLKYSPPHRWIGQLQQYRPILMIMWIKIKTCRPKKRDWLQANLQGRRSPLSCLVRLAPLCSASYWWRASKADAVSTFDGYERDTDKGTIRSMRDEAGSSCPSQGVLTKTRFAPVRIIRKCVRNAVQTVVVSARCAYIKLHETPTDGVSYICKNGGGLLWLPVTVWKLSYCNCWWVFALVGFYQAQLGQLKITAAFWWSCFCNVQFDW